MKTTVSIVMAHYNGKRFLTEQLLSIKSQNYPINELLIMDDCSDNDQFEFLKKIIGDLDLTKVAKIIRNEVNLGYARNFIEGCKQASGGLIFLSDQDDIWMSTKIASMVSTMENNETINLLCCDSKPIYSDNNAPRMRRKRRREMNNSGDLEKCDTTYINHLLRRSGCTMCLRKEFFNNIIQYWVNGWAHDDFFWKMAVYSKSCMILHRILHTRRYHSNNTSEMKIRTIESRINLLRQNEREHISLRKFAEVYGQVEDINTVDHNIMALKGRIICLQDKKFLRLCFIVFRYFNTYRELRSSLLDIYLLFFREHRTDQ